MKNLTYFARSFALALIICAMSMKSAHAQSWQTYGTSTEGSWEIDLSRITRERGLTHYWVRHITPPRLLSRGTESLQEFVANCSSRQIALTSEIKRDDRGKVISQGTLAPNLWQFNAVGPGTIGESALSLVCRGSSTTTSKPSLLTPRLPTPPDWRVVATDEQGKYKVSVSPKTITWITKELATAIVNSDYSASQVSPGGSTYRFHLFEAVINCTSATWDLLRQEFVTDDFNVSDSTEKQPENVRLQSVAPSSVAAQTISYVCTQKPTQPPVAAEPSTETKFEASGTGWVVAQGRIVTAYHVVRGAETISVIGSDKILRKATLASADIPNDIAILSVQFDKWRPKNLPLSRTPPRIGTRVFTIGFPHIQELGTASKFTSGEISANSGFQDDPRYFQISVPVQSGNSGGPLLNARGEVVGIVTDKLDAMLIEKETGDLTQNVNYAIKSRYIQGLLEDLGIDVSGGSAVLESDLEKAANATKSSIVLIKASIKKRE